MQTFAPLQRIIEALLNQLLHLIVFNSAMLTIKDPLAGLVDALVLSSDLGKRGQDRSINVCGHLFAVFVLCVFIAAARILLCSVAILFL